MSNSNNEGSNFIDLMTSILIASFLGILLSHNLTFALTDSNLRDSSLMFQSRPLITVEALNTIASDNTISIVGIGSSMIFKGLDGGKLKINSNCPLDSWKTNVIVNYSKS